MLALAASGGPARAATADPAAGGQALAAAGVGTEAVELGLAVASLIQASRGDHTGLAGPEIALSLVGFGLTGPKIAGFRLAAGQPPGARTGRGEGWLQTGVYQLLLGGIYLATAHLLDEHPWSGESILAEIYAAMALPHLILGAIALPLGIGLRAPGADPDRDV
ncbi:MAG: hypothetical protein QGH45_20435, partial [Myxococcota bacterium]|nr:hypothetical protein [Myxococcota bacterium]